MVKEPETDISSGNMVIFGASIASLESITILIWLLKPKAFLKDGTRGLIIT
jgi:hypothetical protein